MAAVMCRVKVSKFHALFLLLSSSTLICGQNTKEWSKENFPNPIKDMNSCGRRGVMSWICDPDGVLNHDDANKLEEIIHSIALKTTSGCAGNPERPGFQIGVALMEKMSAPYGLSPADSARDFAVHLHRDWGVGHSGCDDGALFLLSVSDRQVYISTGRTAMKKLSDDQIEIIIDEMKPLLREERYGVAVNVAAERMSEVFSGKVLSSGSLYGILWVVGFFGIIAGAVIYGMYKDKQYTKCQEKLKRIEEERNTANLTTKYESKSCPVCLEEFTPQTSTRLLLCGHKYCEPCLTKWLESNATCPICRQSTSHEDEDSSTNTNDFLPELGFRLMCLRLQYPSFISQEMIHHWTASHYDGSFTSDPLFSRANRVFSVERPGSSGSGGGFGGGGCSGGSGGGGSW